MSDYETEMLDEDFSPAEEAYFKSGGEKTEGLLGDGGAGANAGQQTTQPDPATAATDAQKATEAAEAARVKDNRMVPIDALHEARERRKESDERYAQSAAENAALKERWARADERLAHLNQLLAPETGQQKEEAIDPNKDIFGAFTQSQKRLAELEARLEQTGTKFDQQTAAQQQQAVEQQMMSSFVDEARTFIAKDPAFGPAYTHLMNVRSQELKALDPRLTDKQIQAHIAREEKEIVANSKANGTSAVQTIYNLSKLRGFVATKAADPVKTDAEKQLEAIQRGKSASQSLSGGGGVSSEGLTAAKIADMSDDEFADVYSKLSKAEQKRIMGG